MDLLTYYSDLAVAYPEYITQKQFCEVCGICHKTAYNLTRRGEISYEIVDTPTGRIHHIKLTDALAYLYKKDTLYGNDENVNRQIYEVLQAHFSYLPDLLRTQQIRELTGFSMTAIQRWVSIYASGKGWRANFEYFMNREYAYNRDKGKCKCCGRYFSELIPKHCHHVNPRLPIERINKVPNLAWLCIPCHRMVHNSPIPPELDAKAVRKIKKYREKLKK